MAPNKRPYSSYSSSPGYAPSSQQREPKQPRTRYDAYPTPSRTVSGSSQSQSRSISGSSQYDPLVIEDDDEEFEDGSQEVADASQNYNEAEVRYVLYGTWANKVVGCRFYSGYCTMGEIVMCRFCLFYV
jgi:SWI/SNF-related matrix-associated actin-dependent regulator of chromatin subfamily A3